MAPNTKISQTAYKMCITYCLFVQIDMYGFDYGKATDTMKMSMTQATIERNTAVQSMSRLKQELHQLERDKDQVSHSHTMSFIIKGYPSCLRFSFTA